MLVGSKRRFLHFLQVIQERPLCRRTQAKGQRIDEHTDDRLQVGVRTGGNRSADHYIFLSRVFMKQYGVRSQQKHVQRRPRIAGKPFESFAFLRIQRKRERLTVKLLDGRAGEVERQLKNRKLGAEYPAPVFLLPFDALALLLGLLPNGVILVLNPQLRQFFPIVKPHEFAQQHVHGKAVGTNMMNIQREQKFLFLQFDQQGAQQRRLGQVKG